MYLPIRTLRTSGIPRCRIASRTALPCGSSTAAFGMTITFAFTAPPYPAKAGFVQRRMLCYIAHLERGRGGKRKVEYGTLIVRAPCRSGAVEIAIAALHQPCDRSSALVRRAAEGVQRGDVACRVNLENGALIVHPTNGRCAVEVTIGSLRQPGDRSRALGGGGAKGVQHSDCAARRNFKHRALIRRAAGGG